MSGGDPLAEDLLPRCTFPSAGSTVTCAFSGGADSTALIILAVAAGLEVTALHVDHGLRPTSSAEADQAADIAARVGVEFERRTITVAAGGNLEGRARDAAVGEPPARCAHRPHGGRSGRNGAHQPAARCRDQRAGGDAPRPHEAVAGPAPRPDESVVCIVRVASDRRSEQCGSAVRAQPRPARGPPAALRRRQPRRRPTARTHVRRPPRRRPPARSARCGDRPDGRPGTRCCGSGPRSPGPARRGSAPVAIRRTRPPSTGRWTLSAGPPGPATSAPADASNDIVSACEIVDTESRARRPTGQ